MPPAPRPANELARLCALHECDVLDSKPDPEFDAITRLACRLCDVPIAMVSLVDAERQWFKAKTGTSTTQTPRDWALCAYAILSDSPLVIPDTTRDARTADSPLVVGPAGIRFYAGVPLRTSDGFSLGSCCVVDTRPRDISDQQLEDLVILASQVSARLELRRLKHRSHEGVLHVQSILREACEAFSAMQREAAQHFDVLHGAIDGLGAQVVANAESEELVPLFRENLDKLQLLLSDTQEEWHLRSGGGMARPSPFLIREELRSASAQRRTQGEAIPHDVALRISENVPHVVYLDPSCFRDMISRLIRHARDHTNEPVTIEASCTPLTRCQHARLWVHVRFQPRSSFPVRVHPTDLNFSIARELAQAMGGCLSITGGGASAASIEFCSDVLVDVGDADEHPGTLAA